MVMDVITSPTKENTGLAEMIFLSRGYDALTLGRPLVKHARKT
jgi:hypothetical protein